MAKKEELEIDLMIEKVSTDQESEWELDEKTVETKKIEDEDDSPAVEDDDSPEAEDDSPKDVKEAKKEKSEDDSPEDEEEEDEDEAKKQDEEIQSLIDSIAEEILEEEDVDVSDDIDALIGSEEGLTEEFKLKAAAIFEAAVTSKVREQLLAKTSEFETAMATKVESMHEELSASLDNYLGYISEEWLKDNEVAITSVVRSEISEGFIASLKDVFTEHYIEMPEGKTNLFDEIAERACTAEETVDQLKSEISTLTEENVDFARRKIISEKSEGLAKTQVEKMTALVADIEFIDEETFAKKVEIVKESYFSEKETSKKKIKDDGRSVITTIIEEEEENLGDPQMAKYIKALTSFDN